MNPIGEPEFLNAIASQMEIGAEFSDAYLSSKTGFMCRIHEFDEGSDLRRQAEAGHLSLVPPITSQDLYLWMVEFAGGVADAQKRGKLEHSLTGISAVWKFRNALYHDGPISRDWERFKSGKLLAQAKDWLESASNF